MQLVTDVKLGPAGTHALMMALLGSSPGMSGEPYKEMKSIRLWGCESGDDGARGVAHLLRDAPAEKLAVGFMQLFNCDVGARGAGYIGEALGRGGNSTLRALELNHNTRIGDEGVELLCKGLRHNKTLQVCACC
jgi:hypothetical protein